jgi:hypothetical protein
LLDFEDGDGSREVEFPEWDYEPRLLRRGRRERLRDAFADLLVICTALPFFGLAAAVIRVDGEIPEERQEEDFKQSVYVVSLSNCFKRHSVDKKRAATLLPLVFSLVVGRLSIKLASYSLEHGTTLGLLERLMGSQSFFGTLITQLSLWPLNIVAMCLILIWLLSPFGSQAILRSLTVEMKTTTSANNVTYLNNRVSSLVNDSKTLASWFPGFVSLFSASLIAPDAIKSGLQDVWGNPKIPLQFSLLNHSSLEDEDWYTVPSKSQIESRNSSIRYLSLFGIPISTLPRGTTTFRLESSHLALSCHNITTNLTPDIIGLNLTQGGLTLDIFTNTGFISPTGPFISAQNITASTPWAIGYLGHDIAPLLSPASNTEFSLDAFPPNTSEQFPGLLLYQDFTGFQNVTSIYCTPSQSYIESEMNCSDNKCAVSRQRTSLISRAPPDLTPLSILPLLQSLTRLLPLLAPQTPTPTQTLERGHEIDVLQNYLANPDDDIFIQSALWPAATREESRFLEVDLGDFGDRLAGVLNTVLMGNVTAWLVGSDLPLPAGGLTLNVSEAIRGLQHTLPALGAVAVGREVFVCRWPWVAIFLLSTSIMFLTSLAAAIFRHMTLSHDYLGFVSSLCRESAAVEMPSGGVRLSGMQKTRRLKGLRIRLDDVGDVRDGWEIGVGAQLSMSKLGVGVLRGRGNAEVVRGLVGDKLYV